MSARVASLGVFVTCLLGPILWAAHFFILYGAETVVCLSASVPGVAIQATAIAVTLAALGLLGVSLARSPVGASAPHVFLRNVGTWLASLAAAAILAVALSVWHLPACVSPQG